MLQAEQQSSPSGVVMVSSTAPQTCCIRITGDLENLQPPSPGLDADGETQLCPLETRPSVGRSQKLSLVLRALQRLWAFSAGKRGVHNPVPLRGRLRKVL